MRERPILFQGAMVRALLAGTKTQTRRVVKYAEHIEQFERNADGSFYYDYLDELDPAYVRSREVPCPYGRPGDRLWVREAFSGHYLMDADDEFPGMPPRDWPVDSPIWYWADGEPTHGDWTRPRPSIHMPRWASRITLEITGVRVERLQDISEADAIAEGIERDVQPGDPAPLWRNYSTGNTTISPVYSYETLWQSINGPGSWDASPWVWVVEFRRLP